MGLHALGMGHYRPSPAILPPGQGHGSGASQPQGGTQIQEEGGPIDDGSLWFLMDPTQNLVGTSRSYYESQSPTLGNKRNFVRRKSRVSQKGQVTGE